MISVVTLSFNNYPELVQTLESIKDAPEIESIVINGGTCPQTKAHLAGLTGSHLSEKDQGIADAFNKGISLAKGEGVAFLNSGDILVEKDYYQKALEILKKDPSVDFVYADLWMHSESGDNKFYAARSAPYELGQGMPFPHPSLIVRKKVFSQIGGFNTEYSVAMDFEWVLRLIKADYRGYYLNASPIRMDSSGVSVTQEAKALEECKKALRIHGQYQGKDFLHFQMRKFKFQLRFLIKKILGEQALHGLKRLKYKMNSLKAR